MWAWETSKSIQGASQSSPAGYRGERWENSEQRDITHLLLHSELAANNTETRG